MQTLQAWWQQRQERKALSKVAKTGKGYAVRIDALTTLTPQADRQQLAHRIHDWLTTQLSHTATPYGLAVYIVCVGWVSYHGSTRTPLGKQTWSIQHRLDAPATFATVAEMLPTLPLTPTTTHIETYLFSAGDMLNALAEQA